MYILLQDYLSERLQAHFDALKLAQTDTLLEHKALVESLRKKGAIQDEQAPKEMNIFRWPWNLKGDDSDPLFLKHCCLRFFYTYSGEKWEKRELYFTMGLFSTFACKNENPNELADEIMRIDNELIPSWMKDFDALEPTDIMDRAMKCFCHQVHKFHGKELVLDTFAASVYGVSVTKVRQAISRKHNGFTSDEAFPPDIRRAQGMVSEIHQPTKNSQIGLPAIRHHIRRFLPVVHETPIANCHQDKYWHHRNHFCKDSYGGDA